MFVLQIHYCIVLLYYIIIGIHVYSQHLIHFINFVPHVGLCCSRVRGYYKKMYYCTCITCIWIDTIRVQTISVSVDYNECISNRPYRSMHGHYSTIFYGGFSVWKIACILHMYLSCLPAHLSV